MNEKEKENFKGITFIGGIHGVGKSTFAQKLGEELGIPHFSCSQLLENNRRKQFSQSKSVLNIAGNQCELTEILEDTKKEYPSFLLDGHFCLLNSNREITKLSRNTFININPQRIIVLKAPAESIKARRPQMNLSTKEILNFQKTEIEHAFNIAQELNVECVVYAYDEKYQQFIIDLTK